MKATDERAYAIELGVSGLGGRLCCPSCLGDNLHQYRVEVFERKEDSATGRHVAVTRNAIVADDDLTDNPSDRRQGCCVYLWCETCPALAVLKIDQRKGVTSFELTPHMKRPNSRFEEPTFHTKEF